MSEPQFDLDVVLSLFDGISCGQEALKRAGLSTRIFLASEIEKAPKLITRKNHPLTVQLGCVKTVKGENLPKVDLIFAGSPCQDVSFSNGKGKGLVKGERSNLFFEFVRVLEECRKFNPDVKFLLENVKMKKEYQDIISEHLGVEPVMINSSLISAQSRKRLYWTNIPGVTQPKDKGIVLKDILEESPEDYTLMSDKFVNRNKDAGCLIDSDKPKASNLSAMEYVKNGRQGDYIKSDKKGRPCELKDFNENAECHLTTVQKDNVVVNRNIPDEVIHAEVKKLLKGSKYENNFKWKWDTAGRILVMRPDGMKIQRIGRIAFPDNKAEIVTAVTQPHTTYRKLTIIECSRLQTLPDSYLQDCFDDKGKEISNTQKYKALGNGWTVDVIVHLLQGLKQRVAA